MIRPISKDWKPTEILRQHQLLHNNKTTTRVNMLSSTNPVRLSLTNMSPLVTFNCWSPLQLCSVILNTWMRQWDASFHHAVSKSNQQSVRYCAWHMDEQTNNLVPLATSLELAKNVGILTLKQCSIHPEDEVLKLKALLPCIHPWHWSAPE